MYVILPKLAHSVQLYGCLIKPDLECCFIRPNLLLLLFAEETGIYFDYIAWSFILLF